MGLSCTLTSLLVNTKELIQFEAIVTDKGEYPVDLVINAIGFLPNNELGKEHLELFANGAYLVDLHQKPATILSTLLVTVQRFTLMH